ncbi:MAG: LysR family transcriptional regulator [Akkermansia muciniphila]
MVEYYFLSMITDFRLKVFETVARRLNFTRAAEELFITQPAVTRHIKELERLLMPVCQKEDEDCPDGGRRAPAGPFPPHPRNTKRWLKKYPLAAIPLFPAN